MDAKANVTVHARFALAALILGAAYYYWLIYLLGWLNSHERPAWWVGLFSTRLIGALGWLIALHTTAVLLAALPVAFAAVIFMRTKAVLLALTAAVLVAATDVVLVSNSSFWPIIWNDHPMLFVTDHLKIVVAAPLIACVLRAAWPDNWFERLRGEPSGSPGGSR